MAFLNQKAISGYRGRVGVATNNQLGAATDNFLLATKWSLTYKTDLQDASTFEEVTGGLQGAATPISRYVASMTDLEVSIDCYYDITAGWIASLRPGLELNAELFINKPSSIDYGNLPGAQVTDTSPTRKVALRFIVESCTYDVEVRGVIKYTLAGKVSGGTSLLFT